MGVKSVRVRVARTVVQTEEQRMLIRWGGRCVMAREMTSQPEARWIVMRGRPEPSSTQYREPRCQAAARTYRYHVQICEAVRYETTSTMSVLPSDLSLQACPYPH